MPITLTAPGGLDFFKQDVAKTLLTALHEATPELGTTEVANIVARTPQLSGSLAADTTADAYLSISTNVLVELYPADENQLAEYNRVYAQYVEGGLLGDPSSKIDSPSLMYAKVLTDDLPTIIDWGTRALQAGADKFMRGKGQP